MSRLHIAGVVLAAAIALFAAMPVAAHQSAEHGTLDVRRSLTEVATEEVPHFTCDPFIGGNSMDAVNGSIVPLQDPRMQGPYFSIEYEWNATWDFNGSDDGLIVEGGATDDTPPVSFVRTGFTHLPPGYYEFTSYNGDRRSDHTTPPVDFVIDGPCGTPVIPCPTGFTAQALPDGTVQLEWVEHPDSNGTFLMRDVGMDNDFDFLADAPPQANGHHDTTTYAGTTFHYLLISAQPWWIVCGELTVKMPGERTYFPCATGLSAYPYEGREPYPPVVGLSWDEADGANETAVYRADGAAPFELIGIAQGPDDLGFVDVNITEGSPYVYRVNPRYGGVEAADCPTVGLAAGWEFNDCCEEPSECEVVVTLERRSDGILVSWNGAHGIEVTEIFRDEIGDSTEDNGTVYARIEGNATHYLDTAALPDRAYWYGVLVNEGEDPRYCGSSVAASVPNFPTMLAAGLALAGGLLGYSWVRRSRST